MPCLTKGLAALRCAGPSGGAGPSCSSFPTGRRHPHSRPLFGAFRSRFSSLSWPCVTLRHVPETGALNGIVARGKISRLPTGLSWLGLFGSDRIGDSDRARLGQLSNTASIADLKSTLAREGCSHERCAWSQMGRPRLGCIAVAIAILHPLDHGVVGRCPYLDKPSRRRRLCGNHRRNGWRWRLRDMGSLPATSHVAVVSWPVREGAMIKNFLRLAVSVGVFVGASVPSLAADPAFCDQHAKLAIHELKLCRRCRASGASIDVRASTISNTFNDA